MFNHGYVTVSNGTISTSGFFLLFFFFVVVIILSRVIDKNYVTKDPTMKNLFEEMHANDGTIAVNNWLWITLFLMVRNFCD